MPPVSPDPVPTAQVRYENALALFEEFVRATARHADAATLRGLERRFAERVDIQPSYWSQIKGRSRQIGERLARQFEQRCGKPMGWMDRAHGAAASPAAGAAQSGPGQPSAAGTAGAAGPEDTLPFDDDERFIVGLVLTYYRRHPQRARTRLLDLLGEVLTPSATTAPAPPAAPASAARHGAAPAATPVEDAQALWRRSQTGVAPLKRK
jgi:hypothetical protein